MAVSGNSPYYLENFEYFPNGSNIHSAAYGDVSKSFASAVASTSAAIQGYDWTRPFPGSKLDGHGVYLTIGQEMPLSEQIVQNATTVLSSLTYGVPNGLVSGGTPKAMDPSWYICRSVFISTSPSVKKAVDGGDSKCAFLPDACLNDLKALLTQNWGRDDSSMCSAFIFDPIPASCFDSFGKARQDVTAFDSEALADHDTGLLMTNKAQQQYSWRMGTGYHDPYSPEAFQLAANRTYMVATVWGYSKNSEKQQTPDVTFGCVSGGNSYVPKPPTPTTTTTTTTTTTPSVPTATPPPAPSNNVFYETFDDDMKRWDVVDGKVSAVNGQLVARNPGGKALVHDWVLGDIAIQADVMLTLQKPDTAGGLLFRVGSAGAGQNAFQGYFAGISNGTVLLAVANNDYKELARVPASDVVNGQSYRVRAEAVGDVISVYVGVSEQARIVIKDSTYKKGSFGVRDWNSVMFLDNLTVWG